MAKKFGYECPEFRGEDLKFGDRADAPNISPQDAKKFWRGENVIYDRERKAIEIELEKRAQEFAKQKKAVFPKNLDPDVIREISQPEWDSIKSKSEIKKYFQQKDNAKLTADKEEYTKKNLQKSYEVGVIFKILTFVFILVETVVMIGSSIPQGLEEGFSPDFMVLGFGLLLAVFLAGGGWLVGMFLGLYAFDKHLRNNNIADKENLITLNHWLLLIGGSLLILFIAVTRLLAGGFGLFLLTIILGLIISAMKALWEYYDGLRCFVGGLRVSYFQKEASIRHGNELSNYENFFYGMVEKFAKNSSENKPSTETSPTEKHSTVEEQGRTENLTEGK
ncbi:MAG: hypothetical protein N2327_02055 [Caldimicrobium sp.]|nr:hypothetical protein [Caldimicrobium sp.]MDW8095085.1 hypothetical protein [Caldimicrobium sp.]